MGRENNKLTIFISIVAVALFIVGVVAVSYAYYTANVAKENSGNNATNVGAANISATFTDGAELNFQNMIPGDTFTKTFTLKNTGDQTIKYKIVVQEVENTFISQSDIEVVVKENGSTIKTTTFPSTTGAISDELTISPDVSKSYTITITYKNTTADQTPDMGKVISGKIFIEEV